MPVLLDVSSDDADADVEPAELVELVELPDPPVVEAEPTEVSISGIEAGPAPKLDAAGAAGLHAERHSARGIGVRRTALQYLKAASPSGYGTLRLAGTRHGARRSGVWSRTDMQGCPDGGIIATMMRPSVLLSLFFLVAPACSSGDSRGSRHGGTSEYSDEERSAAIFMKDTGRPILHCFHPSQKSRGGAVHSVEFVKPLRTIDATIFMEGYTGSYSMRVKVELDFATQRIRVTPKDENTKYDANPNCALREWTSFDVIDDAASAAKAEHQATVAFFVVAAVALLSRDDAERRAPRCLAEAIAGKAVEEAVAEQFSGTIRQAIVSGAIKQIYDERPSVGGAAKEALSYALMEGVRTRNATIADAIEMASLASCLVR